MHIDHLVQQTDAYGAKHYAQANTIYREGYRHAAILTSTNRSVHPPSAGSARTHRTSGPARARPIRTV